MESTDRALVDARELRVFANGVLQAIGLAPEFSTKTAMAMMWADLRGLIAHGVVRRLEQCVRRVADGGSDPRAVPVVDAGSAALATMDAHNAWGQVAGICAMEAAVKRAQQCGIGMVAVRNTSSPAALGYYPTIALRNDMIGFAVTNCPALMAPPGGTTKVVGNQASAFGIPAGRHHPILFDSGLSEMSTGEMDRRREAGELLPEGVLFDSRGEPTRDPSAWVDGSLAAIGGHRGFGLALCFETLTSSLSGSQYPSFLVSHPFESHRPQHVSLTCVAIDPSSLMPLSTFTAQVDRLIDAVHHSGTRDNGSDGPRVPGERGYLVEEERRRLGVPLRADHLDDLRRLGSEVGVDPSF